MPHSVAILRYSGYTVRGVCALQSSSYTTLTNYKVPSIIVVYGHAGGGGGGGGGEGGEGGGCYFIRVSS